MGFFGGQKNKEVKQKVLCTVYDNTRTMDQEIEAMSHILNNLLMQSLNEGREIIFLCVGSDRSIGDALGPLVGTMLKEEGVSHVIYGTLEDPVHAFNLESTLKAVKRRFRQPLIISIDAGLGEKEQVGAVLLKEGPLLPGQALKKVLPAVGDYHLTGVVNYLDPLPAAQFLNDTRLHTVMKLAKTIVRVIT
ncbi:spore protease YyaC [Domibacillus sp. DTU_2020_1001157_1_SI_ALB_TIR_016]|uniref:spore protease YyaC n=1 Tax=Domibacillus sp. DTU_2020_1001157_1_SI_ALB_TIR_016 TaxID=3077789 RepID=UPI0028EA46A6|nr:spore protease YyaC [Domibacillus sp. DTU_2020_1001157_1_SI_ALB_TIR_016]WNS77990.1 spore protease YyaC [Domibacillus sp. DTU_2020_1001157_1_SI_ALB_TIR_016]